MNQDQLHETKPEQLGPPAPPQNTDVYEVAYAQHEAEIEAIPGDEILSINLDPPAMVTTVLGVVHEIQLFRPQLEQLVDFEIRVFEELESYALALACANTRFLTASEGLEDIKPLYDEALVVRETLVLDARALIHRGLLDSKRIEKLSGTVGHRNIATDLHMLGTLLREGHGDFQGKSGVGVEELDHAVTLSTQLLHAVGRREQADANVTLSAERRARAYTVLLRRYDEVRRGIHFLRWHAGDAEQFMPSLYAGKTRKKAGRSDVAKANSANTPAAPEAARIPALPGATAPGATTSTPTPNATSGTQPYLVS